jgi:hypothetical protein
MCWLSVGTGTGSGGRVCVRGKSLMIRFCVDNEFANFTGLRGRQYWKGRSGGIRCRSEDITPIGRIAS